MQLVHAIALIPLRGKALPSKNQTERQKMKFLTPSVLGIFIVCVLAGGCASWRRHPSPTALTKTSPTTLTKSETSPTPTTLPVETVISSIEAENESILARLWEKRTREGLPSDLALGVGDILEITVSPGDLLKDYAVRIGGDEMISLPLIGNLHAGGQSEAAVEEAIRRRFAETYVRNPYVHVFVREYHSRLAAVVGAVDKPGVYSMTRGNDTILEMLSQAGGPTKEAGARLFFFPAEFYNTANKPVEVASSAVALPTASNGAENSSQPEPLVINLKSNRVSNDNGRYLILPVRPGDVIMVPAAGEVLVDGWVEKPGSYPITPGLTVLGSVTAAGGMSFAASHGQAKVTRIGKQGERIAFFPDLEKIKRGEAPDIPVQEGDVVEVYSSIPKLVPYGIYMVVKDMFRVGAAIY